MRLLAVVLSLSLNVPAFAQAVAPAPSVPQDKEAKLKQLVELLKTFSDQDYKAAIQQTGADLSSRPELASRESALKTGYTTLAALEYKQADARGAKDLQRVLKEDADAVAIDPSTMQETGRGWDILKAAAKAALKFGVMAAIMAIGNEVRSPEQAALDASTSKDEAAAASGGDEAHYRLASDYERQAQAVSPNRSAEAPSERRVWLRKLADFLGAISDEDYRGALQQALQEVPTKGTRPPLLVSREGALEETYMSLAEVEYDQAARLDPSKDDYSKHLARAGSRRAQAAAIDPQGVQETGWAVDVLKFLANAAINYELGGGAVFVGRTMRSPAARKADEEIRKRELELSAVGADAAEQAGLHDALGQAYEARAKASATPETDAERAAKKEARVQELADLLQSVSDDEYKDALKQVAPGTAKRPELSSRKSMLKTAYTTLAGLEYRAAARRAPEEESYGQDFKRVAGEDASKLAINPENMQETGWFTDLLSIAALGGAGYLIYRATDRHGHGSNPPPPPPPPPPTPAGFDGPWTMVWSGSWNQPGVPAPASCKSSNSVVVYGGHFSFESQYGCTCSVLYTNSPITPITGTGPTEGCQGPLSYFTTNGDMDPSGVLSGNNNGQLFTGSCSAAGCTGVGQYGSKFINFTASRGTTPPPDIGQAPPITVTPVPFTIPPPPQAAPPIGNAPPSITIHPRMPIRTHCMAMTPSCGYPSPAIRLVSARVTSLNGAAAGLQTQLAGLELEPAKEAELHHELGSVYEQLVAAVDEPAAKPKAKAEKKPEPEAQPGEERPLDDEIRDLDKSAKDLRNKVESK